MTGKTEGQENGKKNEIVSAQLKNKFVNAQLKKRLKNKIEKISLSMCS